VNCANGCCFWLSGSNSDLGAPARTLITPKVHLLDYSDPLTLPAARDTAVADTDSMPADSDAEHSVAGDNVAGLESDRLRREEIMATCRTEMDRSRNYNYQPASRAVVNYRSAAAVVRNPKLENWDQSPYHYNETGSQNKPLLCVAGGKVPVVEGNSDVKTRWTANLTTFSDSERFVEGKLPYCELMFKAELAEPAVAEPEVAEPDVAAPAVAEPAVAEPAVAEPAVAEPAVTEPEVAGPAVADHANGRPMLEVLWLRRWRSSAGIRR